MNIFSCHKTSYCSSVIKSLFIPLRQTFLIPKPKSPSGYGCLGASATNRWPGSGTHFMGKGWPVKSGNSVCTPHLSPTPPRDCNNIEGSSVCCALPSCRGSEKTSLCHATCLIEKRWRTLSNHHTPGRKPEHCLFLLIDSKCRSHL